MPFKQAWASQTHSHSHPSTSTLMFMLKQTTALVAPCYSTPSLSSMPVLTLDTLTTLVKSYTSFKIQLSVSSTGNSLLWALIVTYAYLHKDILYCNYVSVSPTRVWLSLGHDLSTASSLPCFQALKTCLRQGGFLIKIFVEWMNGFQALGPASFLIHNILSLCLMNWTEQFESCSTQCFASF